MAHPTDYPSQKDISRLKRSPSSMNPTIFIDSNAYTLVLNFLHENPNWSIDSLVVYCLRQYSDFGVTREIISDAIKSYITE